MNHHFKRVNADPNRISEVELIRLGSHPEEEDESVVDQVAILEAARAVHDERLFDECLAALARFGNILEVLPSSVIRRLVVDRFFQTFAMRSRRLRSVESIHCYLTVLSHFAFLPIPVCVQFLTLSLFQFLRTQLFSSVVAIQKLVVGTLLTLAKDSEISDGTPCRRLICASSMIQDVGLLIIGSVDRELSSLCVHLICQLLSCDAAVTSLSVITRTAVFLLQKESYRPAIRMLLFVAEMSDAGSAPFASPGFPRLLLSVFARNQADDKLVFLSLKLFLVRTAWPEEALLYFQNGILKVLNAAITRSARRAAWICWVFGNVIKNVDEAVESFFALGLFDVLAAIISDWEYEAKSAAAVLLANIVNRRLDLDFVEDPRTVGLLREAIELLQSGSTRTICTLLEMCLAIVRLETASGVAAIKNTLREESCVEAMVSLLEHESRGCSELALQLCCALDVGI
jgi:hypothetical protein